MEKEALISALKEKTGVDNLSERTIDEVATLFLPSFADDEKITDESWKIPVQMVKTMSGQLRHDLSGGINDFKTKFENENKTIQEKAIADAIAKAKAEWEKEHPSQKTAEENHDEDGDVDKKIADAIAKAMGNLTGEEGVLGKLNKQFGDFLKSQEEKERTATESQMRKNILEYVMSFDELDADDPIVENTMLKIVIEKGKDINALKAEAKSTYEKCYKKFVEKHGGGQPFTGGGGEQGGMSPAVKSHIDRVKKETEDAQNYQNSIQFAK